jgi:hypothetical protein
MDGHQKFVLGLKILATIALVYNRMHMINLEHFNAYLAAPVDAVLFFAIWRSGLTK